MQKIRYQALLALQNIAAAEQEAYEMILQEESIIDVVITTLKRQPDSVSVQSRCIQFLSESTSLKLKSLFWGVGRQSRCPFG